MNCWRGDEWQWKMSICKISYPLTVLSIQCQWLSKLDLLLLKSTEHDGSYFSKRTMTRREIPCWKRIWSPDVTLRCSLVRRVADNLASTRQEDLMWTTACSPGFDSFLQNLEFWHRVTFRGHVTSSGKLAWLLKHISVVCDLLWSMLIGAFSWRDNLAGVPHSPEYFDDN